jgi:SAM-dependent methyltransferase
MSSSFWDERFSQEAFVYGTAPNVFFKQCLDNLSPGKILLPAEGEGRHAVYAARLGWEVCAVDYALSGKEKAMKLAAEHHVTIHYDIASIEDYEAETSSFDAIGLIFAHFAPGERQQIHHKLLSWLKPGGNLILEGFHTNQLGRASGGPKDVSMLFDESMLRSDFKSCNIQLLETTERILDEGAYHQGSASLIHILAVKN